MDYSFSDCAYCGKPCVHSCLHALLRTVVISVYILRHLLNISLPTKVVAHSALKTTNVLINKVVRVSICHTTFLVWTGIFLMQNSQN